MDPTFKSWFINISEVQHGQSSVLGGNFAVFYTIHFTGLIFCLISLASCVFVIISVLEGKKEDSRGCLSRIVNLEFEDRFPFYLALVDGMMSFADFLEHFYLLVAQKFPENEAVSELLSIMLNVFVGNQQLMHAGLSIYMYFTVVWGIRFRTGVWDWKLHAICWGIQGGSLSYFIPRDAYGPSGYWMLQNLTTKAGRQDLGTHYAVWSVLLALGSTFSFISIQRTVKKTRLLLLQHNDQVVMTGHHETATECLNTFIRISLYLYCPFPIIYITFFIQTSVFGVIEPITALLITISANCSGWANAVGYFHNRRVKKKKSQERNRLNRMKDICEDTQTVNSVYVIKNDN